MTQKLMWLWVTVALSLSCSGPIATSVTQGPILTRLNSNEPAPIADDPNFSAFLGRHVMHYTVTDPQNPQYPMVFTQNVLVVGTAASPTVVVDGSYICGQNTWPSKAVSNDRSRSIPDVAGKAYYLPTSKKLVFELSSATGGLHYNFLLDGAGIVRCQIVGPTSWYQAECPLEGGPVRGGVTASNVRQNTTNKPAQDLSNHQPRKHWRPSEGWVPIGGDLWVHIKYDRLGEGSVNGKGSKYDRWFIDFCFEPQNQFGVDCKFVTTNELRGDASGQSLGKKAYECSLTPGEPRAFWGWLPAGEDLKYSLEGYKLVDLGPLFR